MAGEKVVMLKEKRSAAHGLRANSVSLRQWRGRRPKRLELLRNSAEQKKQHARKHSALDFRLTVGTGRAALALGEDEHDRRSQMKTVENYREAFYEFSGKASDISRQLAFADIAVIWLSKTDTPTGHLTIPHQLILPGILVVAALAVDLLQYITASFIWRSYYRYLERNHISEVERHNVWLERPIDWLFRIKIVLVIVAYILILLFLIRAFGLM